MAGTASDHFAVSEEGRPLLLDAVLFPSSEHAFNCTFFDKNGPWHRPLDELEETSSGEFQFVQVAPHDFTLYHDCAAHGMQKIDAPKACLLAAAESESCATPGQHSKLPRQSVSDSELKSEVQRASEGAGAATFPERVVVRNTFIQVESGDSDKVVWHSCPAVIMTQEHHTIYPAMERAHIEGTCRPCAYFLSKSDGCREGELCKFCHLCPPGALKRKKKEKVKALKERDYRKWWARNRGW